MIAYLGTLSDLGDLKASRLGVLMEGSLQHQNSTTAFQRNYKSCMWDWLRVFDLNHRVTVRKLIEDSSHGGGHAGSERAEIPGYYYAPLRASERGDLDGESNFQTVNKGNQTKSSGKALISSLILKKLLFRKHRHRQTSATPPLGCTNSFHHSDCDDYVLPVELTSKFDFVSAKHSDSSVNNGKLQQLPRIRKCGTMESVNLLGQTELEQVTKSKAKLAQNALLHKEESVEELGRNAEFLFRDDDSFPEMIEDSDLVLENIFRDFCRSSSKRVLGKSGSLKSVALLDNRQINNSPNLLQISFKHSTEDAPKSEAAANDDHSAHYNSNFLSRSSLQFTKQVTHGTPLSHSSIVKKEMKNAIVENRKEHLHISRDGLLHKIPYGQTISGDVMKEKLFRSASARCYGESIRDNVSIPPKVYPSLRFRRSHSLTEYPNVSSHVQESSSTREFTSLPESLMSTKVDLQLPDTKASTLGSFPCQEVTIEPLDESMLTKAAAPNYIMNKNEAVDIPSLAEPTTGDKLENVKPSIQPDLCEKQILDVRTDATVEEEMQLPLVMNGFTEDATSKVPWTNKNTNFNLLPTHELVDQQESHLEHHQTQFLEVSDSSQIQASHAVDEHEFQVDSSDEFVKPSPTSVLELDFGSDLFRPAEYELPEADSEIDSKCLNIEKPDFVAKTISDDMDGSKYDFDKKKAKVFAAVDINRTHLDQKDEEGFNYVRSVLRKSGFNGFESLVNPLLSEKLRNSFDDLGIPSYCYNDASPDHQILSDLISEILLELSEKFSISSWFSCFGPRKRTMPVECNVLEEVWKKASMLLSSQSLPAHIYECAVARDIAKDDRWLNVQQDAVILGMELESLVLDDLLEELAFEHLEDL